MKRYKGRNEIYVVAVLIDSPRAIKVTNFSVGKRFLETEFVLEGEIITASFDSQNEFKEVNAYLPKYAVFPTKELAAEWINKYNLLKHIELRAQERAPGGIIERLSVKQLSDICELLTK